MKGRMKKTEGAVCLRFRKQPDYTNTYGPKTAIAIGRLQSFFVSEIRRKRYAIEDRILNETGLIANITFYS